MIRHFIYTAAFFTLSVSLAFAGKIEKGFERLKIYDYFLAKEYFEESLEKETPAAAYGLSKIFSVNKNPFYNPDSARRYILIADSTLRIVKEKKKIYYSTLGVTDSAISALSAFICEDAFEIAEDIDSVNAYNHYINKFSGCEMFDDAIVLRNAAAFRDAKTKGTSTAFKEFMAAYPQSEQYDEAMSKYDELIYAENTSEKTIESYAFFIQNYPESPYRGQAEKMIYTLSVPNKSIKQYVAFIHEYGDSRYVGDAWHEVYRLSMSDFSEESFNRFKANYPDYPFPDELESDYVLQNYIFLPIETDEKWGYINELGEAMIEPKFDDAGNFSDGLAAVAIDEKYGFINKAGKMVIDLQFSEAESFINGLAIVMMDSLYGVINKLGEFVIKPKYEELSEAGEDIFMGVKEEQAGYIRKNGKEISRFAFDVAGEFRNGYAIVSKDEKYGLMNISGFLSVDPIYEDLAFIGDGLLKAQNSEGNYGIVTVIGQTVLPFEYDAIGEFSDHRALVAMNGKCGYVDEKGIIKIPINYRYSPILISTAKFHEGFALLKQKYKSIVIDTTGKAISFIAVEDYGSPSEGLIPVRKSKKWGYADLSGKIKIPCRYEAVSSFSNGYATVRYNKMAGLIENTGIIFIQPLFEDVALHEHAIVVRNLGKYGAFTRAGILLIPCQYEKIEFVSSTVIRATDEQGMTYVNLLSGKIIYSEKVE